MSTAVASEMATIVDTLQNQLGMSAFVMKMNLEGITHAESIVMPKPEGNCLNWVVGHMVRSRVAALGLLSEAKLVEIDDYSGYTGGKDAAFNPSQALPFDEIVRDFNIFQQPLVDALGTVSASTLTGKAPFSPSNNPDETVGTLLMTLMFHEAYHAGQTGILRRLVGKSGAF